ncbi:MAG TPA: 23S rRNA (pseudouridine(1915)-N(3))-methyltransferase RlmH [Caulobacteraceae bacterium]
MKITLLCVGKLGGAPEAGLAADWVKRAGQVGRSLGLFPVEIVEVEAPKLLARAGEARLIACDERGQALASRALAERLARLRDDGVAHLAFAVGGADGLDPAVRARAAETLAFGPQTWPHALARAMLAEQVYRATSILAGLPYHRD